MIEGISVPVGYIDNEMNIIMTALSLFGYPIILKLSLLVVCAYHFQLWEEEGRGVYFGNVVSDKLQLLKGCSVILHSFKKLPFFCISYWMENQRNKIYNDEAFFAEYAHWKLRFHTGPY